MQSLEAEQSIEAIEAGFVADYGLTILMAPPPEGFNLVGYFLPALAIVSVGLLLLGLLVRGGPNRERVASGAEISAADEERLRDALRKFDEAEGPDW
jgi:cytochrome c-type biogenesis protein CcmH/NrfF|tara:strand:- start:472 stop:762 length:291 start_codon:yes stop_codon:yes gene_type:complete